MQAGLAGMAGLTMADTAWAGQAQVSRPPLQTPAGTGPVPDEWTQAERLPLWPRGVPGKGFAPPRRAADMPPTFLNGIAEPDLHVFRPAQSNGRAVLVIPGGAYVFVSIRNEGVDVARSLTERGFTVFVLTYRLPGEGWEHRADVPLQDAQRAMRVIRARAAQDGFNPASVLVLGFSAGGHLAASLLTGHDEVLAPPTDALDRTSARPLAGGLIYPVIAMAAPYTHALSAATLLGDRPGPTLVKRRSPAMHVNARTPPVFLVHALDDPAVPYQNSMMMAEALTKAGHPPEMHLFAEGGHGFGTGPINAPAGQWPSLFVLWAERIDAMVMEL